LRKKIEREGGGGGDVYGGGTKGGGDDYGGFARVSLSPFVIAITTCNRFARHRRTHCRRSSCLHR